MNKIKLFLVTGLTTSVLFGFEPTYAIVGEFSYLNNSKDIHELETPGFDHVHEDIHADPENGFNFNYAELEVIAPLGGNLELTGVIHMDENNFEVEELYASTHKSKGINFKVGKFFSSFGKNNNFHKHTWDYSTQPLINNLLLGEHGLNEKGIALTWNNRNLKVGLEVLNGENENSFGRDAVEATNISISKADSPKLAVAYIKFKQRVGTAFVNTGLSYASGDTRIDHTTDTTPHALKASTKLKGVDLELRFPITRTSDVRWTNEYIAREVKGTEYLTTGASEPITKDQSGFYSSLMYKINPKYKIGARYEKVLSNDVLENGINKNLTDNIKLVTALVEYKYNDNSMIMVQYTKDQSKYDGASLVTNNEFIVQYTLSFETGKHEH